MMKQITGENPIIYSDYPDADVIRVGDTYYMISTTMHFMPGGVILRSYDLVQWEIASYVYERLDDTPGQCLDDGRGIYGKGMWAASLRYHEGTYYVCFVANDTGKTYLYRATSVEGPWQKSYIEGFYHDSSLLFDEDGKVYIAYGNREIFITELNEELTAPKQGGLHRLAVKDTDEAMLGYEGAHFYKRNGKYYLFLIHWPKGGLRTESCFVADDIRGGFTGGDVLSADLDGRNSGVAQGGIVDTPEGDCYAVLFQDHGAIGRIPVLVPVTWENDFPVFGTGGSVPKEITLTGTESEVSLEPLWCSDDFYYTSDENGTVSLKKQWQWNHTPDNRLWSVTQKPGTLRLRSGKLCTNVCQAVNTLTQRTIGEVCAAEVTLDGSGLNSGDFAGLCALQGDYGFIALTKTEDGVSLVMAERKKKGENSGMGSYDSEPAEIKESLPMKESRVTLRLEFDFSKGADTAKFYYKAGDSFQKLGNTKQLYFRLDHFVGCRFGLFLFSTEMKGGVAEFSNFTYSV